MKQSTSEPIKKCERTNINICWIQQIDVFRDWWVRAEAKQHLGFIGRKVCSFTVETTVPPGCRRRGAAPLKACLETVYEHFLRDCGPSVQKVPEPFKVSPLASRLWEDVLYQQWAGNPFIYDIRQPNGVFDKLTGVLTTYFNSDEVSTQASARGCLQGTGANSFSCVRVRPTALPEPRACSRRC